MKKFIWMLLLLTLPTASIGAVYYDAWTPDERCSFEEGNHLYWKKIDDIKNYQPDGKHEVYHGHELRYGKFKTVTLRTRRPNPDRGTHWTGLPNDYLRGYEVLKATWIEDIERE